MRPDPRLTFLLRCAVRHHMVESGVMDLQEAFGDLADELIAYRAIGQHFDDIHRRDRARRLRAWRKS